MSLAVSTVSKIPSLSSSKSISSVTQSLSLSGSFIILAGSDIKVFPHLKPGVSTIALNK